MKSNWHHTAFIIFMLPILSCSSSQPPMPPWNRTYDVDIPAVFVGTSSTFGASFEIKNDLAWELEIVSVEKSCACTDVDLVGVTIKKGEIKKVPVRIKVESTYETKTVDISVVLKDGVKWRYRLHFKVYPIAAFDRKIIEFGSFTNTVAQAEFTVIFSPDDRGLTPHLAKVISSSPFLVIQGISQEKQIENGREVVKFRYKATVNKVGYSGPQMVYIYVKYLFDGMEREIVLPVTWTAPEVLSATPARLFIDFNIVSEDTQTHKFIVKSSDRKEFKILDLKSNCKDLELKWSIESSKSAHVFTVVVKRASVGVEMACDITIRTDIGSDVDFKIPVIIIGKR